MNKAIILSGLLVMTGLTCDIASAATLTTAAPTANVDISLANEARSVVRRGQAWLLAQQKPEGYFSVAEFPALTGLALWALVKGGCADTQAVDRAVAYIVSCAHPNGAIYREPKEIKKGGGMPNYNTAICMVALHATGRADLVPLIQKARTFVAGTQHFGDDVYQGGMGYDAETQRAYADLSNSYLAFEAMRLTQSVEDLRQAGDKKADLDWKAAQKFIQRIQNLPGSNDQAWASNDPADRGGFAYRPDASNAGAATNADGTIRLRSYGSMTYAGLLSFIYAQVDRSDERVTSAFDWATRRWSLDENPGMGAQGLYYFYNVLAKGLAAYGEETLQTADGRKVAWRTDLIRKLLSLQKVDTASSGVFWVNSEGRWWEADPVLVTAYTLLALEIALGQ